MPPRHPRRDSGFVQSPSAHPIPGKLDCPSLPFPDSKSTTWEFFTDDDLGAQLSSMRVAQGVPRFTVPFTVPLFCGMSHISLQAGTISLYPFRRGFRP
jgi:hypothetical protein